MAPLALMPNKNRAIIKTRSIYKNRLFLNKNKNIHTSKEM
jgi:hypothetical protein